MTFIIIKIGDETAMFANADCHVRVLLDWLREQVESLLPPTAVDLDLCDETGSIRLLTELPATANALLTLQLRGIYHPVVYVGGASTHQFRLLQPPQSHDRRREMQKRLNRSFANWVRLKQKLAQDASLEKLLETMQKAFARTAKGTPDQWDQSDRNVSKRDRRSFHMDSASSERRRMRGIASQSMERGNMSDRGSITRDHRVSSIH